MFSHELIEQRKRALLEPCWYWTRGLSKEAADRLISDIVDAYFDFRASVAQCNGQVTVYRNTLKLLALDKPSVVPIDEAHPHECAGPDVNDEIALAYKLWLDRDPSLMAIIDRVGLATTFAVAAVSAQHASEESLLRVNAMLVQLLQNEVEFAKEEADDYRQLSAGFAKELGKRAAERLKSLQRARQANNQERLRKSKEQKDFYYQAAIDYWSMNPHAKSPEVVSFLAERHPGRKRSVIKQYIAGAKAQALRRLTMERRTG